MVAAALAAAPAASALHFDGTEAAASAAASGCLCLIAAEVGGIRPISHTR
jgi:hypothetical protein